MTNINPGTCKKCKHWFITPTYLNEEHILFGKPDVHYCHRYPQTIAKHQDDFCGEFIYLGWREQEDRRHKMEKINEKS